MAARRPRPPATRCLLLLAVLLSASSPARALRFDLESGRTKCISDEIKVSSIAVGKYHVVGPDPNSPDSQLPDSHRISVRVTSPYGNSMHYAENVQSGHFAFTAAEAGDYLACFWAPDHKRPVTISFEFDWRSNVTAKDWPSVAKKGQVDVSEAGDALRTPATISFLPAADAAKGEARKETVELFPQNAVFGSETGAQEAPDARDQEKRQLTIFYGGKVLVFDDFPAKKAKDLMQLASKGASPARISALLPSSAAATVTDSTKVSAVPAPASALPVAQVNAQEPVRPSAADLPQARKASLHRFLVKRKDRLNAKAPYQGSLSDATPVKKELLESRPWLGLGSQVASPGLSLRPECSQ